MSYAPFAIGQSSPFFGPTTEPPDETYVLGFDGPIAVAAKQLSWVPLPDGFSGSWNDLTDKPVITPFAETLLDDIDEAAARVTLSVDSSAEVDAKIAAVGSGNTDPLVLDTNLVQQRNGTNSQTLEIFNSYISELTNSGIRLTGTGVIETFLNGVGTRPTLTLGDVVSGVVVPGSLHGADITVLRNGATDTTEVILVDWQQSQSGGAKKFYVTNGGTTAASTMTIGINDAVGYGARLMANVAGVSQVVGIGSSNKTLFNVSDGAIGLQPEVRIGGSAWTYVGFDGNVHLFASTANILEMRKGTAAQRLNIYNRRDSSINNEGFAIDWQTVLNECQLRTFANGTGIRRILNVFADIISARSPDGTLWAVTVDDTGALTTALA